MVRAILDGSKTQTRRILKGSTEFKGPYNPAYLEAHERDPGWKTICPYGSPGDQLWVRETFTVSSCGTHVYRADATDQNGNRWHSITPGDPDREVRWKPSIFMPRAASRLTLEIVKVRIERLNEITHADAIAEGCSPHPACPSQSSCGDYERLWESINGPGSWEANPWVWVVEFRRDQNANKPIHGRN
jgi:hypothetical protein